MINIIPGVQSTASALTAERVRMEAISQNIANSNNSRDIDGKPFQRNIVVFESALQNAQRSLGGVSPQMAVASIKKDTRQPLTVHQPGHPHANESGMVSMPNINIYEEMADLIVASRSYEANLAVVKTGRMMTMQTLAIGKR